MMCSCDLCRIRNQSVKEQGEKRTSLLFWVSLTCILGLAVFYVAW